MKKISGNDKGGMKIDLKTPAVRQAILGETRQQMATGTPMQVVEGFLAYLRVETGKCCMDCQEPWEVKVIGTVDDK